MTATQKFRVDSFVASLAIKAPCVTHTIANITLSALQTINGVVLAVGDRVLVKDQTDASENGIYEAEISAWVRAGDWDGNRDATNGTLVIVAIGTAVTIWEGTGTNPIVIGTSDVAFAQTV
jgi:phage-related tail fiber protein